jgi:hypothetical protein
MKSANSDRGQGAGSHGSSRLALNPHLIADAASMSDGPERGRVTDIRVVVPR